MESFTSSGRGAFLFFVVLSLHGNGNGRDMARCVSFESNRRKKRVTKKSKNALENRVFDFALVSPSEYEKG